MSTKPENRELPYAPRTCLFDGCQRRKGLYELTDAWDMHGYGYVCAEHGETVGTIRVITHPASRSEPWPWEQRLCIVDQERIDGHRLVLVFGRDRHERLTLYRPGEYRDDA